MAKQRNVSHSTKSGRYVLQTSSKHAFLLSFLSIVICLLILQALVPQVLASELTSPANFRRTLQLNQGPPPVTIPLSEAENLTATRLELPEGYAPLGMIDNHTGYLLDDVRINGFKQPASTLWRYDFVAQSFSPIVDYRQSESSIAAEIVFSERWLIWMELGAYQPNANGGLQRDVRLWARDLQSDVTGESDRLLATGISTPAEVFSLPFSSLSLSADFVAYRYSTSSGGVSTTEVHLHGLTDNAEPRVLDRRNSRQREQIISCSLNANLLVWDVQNRFSEYADMLPDHEYDRFSLLSFDLAKFTDVAYQGDVLVGREANRMFYAPLGSQKSFVALMRLPFRRNTSNFMPNNPLTWRGSGSDAEYIEVQQGFYNAIVGIEPSMGSATILVSDYGYATLVMGRYALENNAPLSIAYGNPHVGKRLLSWSSNIGDALYVFDLAYAQFIELPHEFGDDMDLCVTGLPGLDADYLLFFLSSDENVRYILRLG